MMIVDKRNDHCDSKWVGLNLVLLSFACLVVFVKVVQWHKVVYFAKINMKQSCRSNINIDILDLALALFVLCVA